MLSALFKELVAFAEILSYRAMLVLSKLTTYINSFSKRHFVLHILYVFLTYKYCTEICSITMFVTVDMAGIKSIQVTC
jgi:hypothetical protein